MRILGHLYLGQVSSRRPAVLVVEDHQVHFESNGVIESRSIRRGDLRIHPRLGSIPRVIEVLSVCRFETDDFAAVEILEQMMGQKNRIYQLENKWRVALPIAVAFVITLILIVEVLIPRYSRFLAPMVSLRTRERLSAPFELFLERTFKLNKKLSGEAEDRLQSAIKQLKAAEPEINRVDLIDSPTPNAFILPDNHIYITTALVQLASSSDELLAVFLHESGHHVYAHPTQAIIENASLSFFIFLFSGGAEWTNIPLLVLQNSYSRQNELEADMYCVTRLQQLHKDPLTFASIFERLQMKVGASDNLIPSFLSTHPSFDQRIRTIRELKMKR